ncbi:hypothetical protein WISP_61170 [Willisornis vidua]|uniref:Uncharacterized protein n=1 Tax=Willisornis vidua TaxID=1566151 RepID=A0ABQ9DBT7_9PASS|nr:hypothetical protein WISP_61170 [Willisornis vidua]
MKGKCSGSPRGVQLTATCWALATAYPTLLGVVQHCQEEEKRSRSAGTMSTQTTAEPEKKRNKSTSTMSTRTTAEPEGKGDTSTSTMSTQTTEELEGQQKPISVAPVQKRKSKTKSVHVVNDEEEAGSSPQADQMEPEIITWFLSVGELRELRREFT